MENPFRFSLHTEARRAVLFARIVVEQDERLRLSAGIADRERDHLILGDVALQGVDKGSVGQGGTVSTRCARGGNLQREAVAFGRVGKEHECLVAFASLDAVGGLLVGTEGAFVERIVETFVLTIEEIAA